DKSCSGRPKEASRNEWTTERANAQSLAKQKQANLDKASAPGGEQCKTQHILMGRGRWQRIKKHHTKTAERRHTNTLSSSFTNEGIFCQADEQKSTTHKKRVIKKHQHALLTARRKGSKKQQQ